MGRGPLHAGFVPSPLPAHQTGSLGVYPELLLGSHYVGMVEETTDHMTEPNLQPHPPPQWSGSSRSQPPNHRVVLSGDKLPS